MPVVIRAATAADRREVLPLLEAQLREHSIQPPDSDLEFAVDRILEAPERGRVLVASADDQLVGVAVVLFSWSVEHGGAAAWLDELYVRPERREGGIGRQLLQAVRALATAEGAHALDLEVEAGHERAANLYRREGFEAHARQHWMLRLQPAPRAVIAHRLHLGGCLCGAVRYRAEAAPFDVSHCHCGLCRRSTGAPFVTWATFPASSFTFTAGTPRERNSTPQGRRSFCGDCGTALTFRETARPNSVDVTVGSLDDPERVTPVDHAFVGRKLSWLQFADALPRFEAGNPAETDCPDPAT